MTRCGCEKEDSTQSEFSPGVVLDFEPIVYALVNPETSSVKDVSKSRLKQSDLSVCRAAHTTGPEGHANIVQSLLAKNSNRTEEGFFYALCSEIRAITLGETNQGAFCVIDDALEGFEAHAHLGYSEPDDPKLKNHRESARANLSMLFKRRGVFKDWNGDPFVVL